MLLNPPKELRGFEKEFVGQLVARKKASKKLPGWISTPGIVLPPPLSTEQASSAIAAEYKKKLLAGELLVDLTGGTGVDSLAFSEQFEKTTYVEADKELCSIFAHNQKQFGKQIEVIYQDAASFLDQFQGRAHFYIDPARRDERHKKVFRFADCSPDVTLLLQAFEEKAYQVLVKASPLIDIKMALKDLKWVETVYVLSIHNECKEVLFLLDFARRVAKPAIHCINIASHKKHVFQFDFDQEGESNPEFGVDGDFLYDPNSSILKAGAFKRVASQYGLQKVARNTHLYCSRKEVEHFPGRIFSILHRDPSKLQLKEIFDRGEGHVVTKNYPEKAEAISKKLGLKPDGKLYLFAFRDVENKRRIFVGEKVSG